MTLNSNLDFKIDIDVNNIVADTIKATVGNTGLRKIVLNDVNFYNGELNVGDNFIVQILKLNNNKIQLELGNDEYILKSDSNVVTNMSDNMTWDAQIIKSTSSTDTVAKLSLETVTTDNDSIKVNVEEVQQQTVETLGDTLMYINQSTDYTEKNFNAQADGAAYTVNENLGATKGTVNINGFAGGSAEIINFNGKTGFELGDSSTALNIKDVTITNANYIANGTNENSVINLENVVLDGTNGDGIKSAGTVNITGETTVKDDITLSSSNAQINLKNSNNIQINSNLTGTGAFNTNNATVSLGDNANVSGLNATINNTNLKIANENSLNGLNTTFNGTNNVNIANNSISTLALGNVNLDGLVKMQIDADLANEVTDKLSADNVTVGVGGAIQIDKINLLSPTDQKCLDLLFTENSDLAQTVSYTGEGQIAYSPIYKYNTSYFRASDGSGYFRFETPGYNYDNFNPSVMASSVTAIVTGYQSQMQILSQGFYHMDRYMKHPSSYRYSVEKQ